MESPNTRRNSRNTRKTATYIRTAWRNATHRQAIQPQTPRTGPALMCRLAAHACPLGGFWVDF